MSGPSITDAAVEAGARRIFNGDDDPKVDWWADATCSDRETYLATSELVLTAALPHIRRSVIEELVEKAEAQSAEAYSGFDMLPQHLKGFPEGQRQRSLGVQANHAHWWLRAELEGDDRG